MSDIRRNILQKTLTLILAGGQGETLLPLTVHRSKPSVSFGGIYRLIDFCLSNCLNSGLRHIYALTQYRSLTLDQHIKHGWDIFNIEIDEFIYSVPPQNQAMGGWYQGMADAVFQNVYLFNIHRPERVLILPGDHVYKMDFYPLLNFHAEKGADVTMAAVRRCPTKNHYYGVVKTDKKNRAIDFLSQPKMTVSPTSKPEKGLCNMGIYVFQTDALVRAVMADAKNDRSGHSFRNDILPQMIQEGKSVYVYPFHDTNQTDYWEDINTIDSYFQASMNLTQVTPAFNLYDQEWPLRHRPRQFPPAKTVFSQEEHGGRLGTVLDSIISPGCIVSGGKVSNSVLSYNVRVNSYSSIEKSILMEGVTVGRHAKLRQCIVDEGVTIPEGMHIGYDRQSDESQFTVTPEGVTVVAKGFY